MVHTRFSSSSGSPAYSKNSPQNIKKDNKKRPLSGQAKGCGWLHLVVFKVALGCIWLWLVALGCGRLLLVVFKVELGCTSCNKLWLVALGCGWLHQIMFKVALGYNRELKQPNPHEIWIGVAGMKLRFGIEEFALVTGIRCVGSHDKQEYARPSNSFLNTYYKGMKKVTKENVREILFNKGWKNDADAVKLANIYLLHIFLLGSSSLDAVIPQADFDILDSGEFGQFPWGKEVFKVTIESLKNNVGKKTKDNFYRLYGFPYAFQVWFYECCPCLNGNFCHLNAGSIPRIINWTNSENIKFDKVSYTLSMSCAELQLRNITPTAKERKKLHLEELFPKGKQLEVDGNLAANAGARVIASSSGVAPHSARVAANVCPIANVSDDDFVNPPPRSFAGASSSSMPQFSLREMQAQLLRLETSHKVLVSDVASIKTIVNGLSSHFDSSILKLHDLILSHILGKQGESSDDDIERRSKAMHDESNVGDKEEEVATDCVIEEKSDDEEDEKDDGDGDGDGDEDEDEGESDEENDGFDHDDDEDVDDDPVGEDKNSKDREKEDHTYIVCPSGVKDVSSGHNEDDNVVDFSDDVDSSHQVAPKILGVADFATEVENVTTSVGEIDKDVASHFSNVAELETEVAPNLPEVAPDLPEVAELAKVAEDVNEVAQVAGTISSQCSFDSLSNTALEEAMQNAINAVKAFKTPKESTPHCIAIVPYVGSGGSNLGYVTPIFPRRTIKLPFYLQSPFVQNFDCTSAQSSEAKSGGDIKIIKGFCPLDDKIGELPDYELSQDFNKWLDYGMIAKNKVKMYSKEDNLIIPGLQLGVDVICQKTWFHTLQYSGKNLFKTFAYVFILGLRLVDVGCLWLRLHVDVFFYYLRKKAKYCDNCTIKFITTDSHFQTRINSIYETFLSWKRDFGALNCNQYVAEVIMGYALPCNISWSMVDHVLFPILLMKEKHWLLCRLSLKDRSMYVYNTLTCDNKDHIALKAVESFRILLPHYLYITGFYDRTDIDFSSEAYAGKSTSSAFDVVLDDDLPCGLSCDSGIHMFSFAEYFVQDKDIPTSTFDVETHRSRLAFLFYSYAKAKEIYGYESESEYSGRYVAPRKAQAKKKKETRKDKDKYVS
ncbi:uncharacterized protein LOC133814352 [Humulus lupulus]|uniref:uncharacterized protein LOC133814352 n=1 Tax=Humulus lupulus TaxID=3486 RepID=UPI002B41459C|nr:uncharacterized protein LOC133814352 [Humulus lupulus]